jgi:hypothetical protein
MQTTSSAQTFPRLPSSTEDFALESRFNDLVIQFTDAPASQLDYPVSHWAVSSDRRLPYALLGRTVRDLVTASFESLRATPGVGHKKFASLLALMQRVLDTEEIPADTVLATTIESAVLNSGVFKPEHVSQVMWAEWQETVRQHRLQDETLGRLAPTLQSLPTVIWKKTLGDYLQYTIAELRSLKTHGDKRVTAVLEVFHLVHGMLGESTRSSRVAIQLTPTFVPPIEQWLRGVLSTEAAPTIQDIRQHFVLPLLNQIERDAGETVHRLAAGRLGIEAFPESVRDQAKELGVTRARIYQLFETCGDVLQTRWPEGRWAIRMLSQQIQTRANDSESLDLLDSLQWLLYPTRREKIVAEPAIA